MMWTWLFGDFRLSSFLPNIYYPLPGRCGLWSRCGCKHPKTMLHMGWSWPREPGVYWTTRHSQYDLFGYLGIFGSYSWLLLVSSHLCSDGIWISWKSLISSVIWEWHDDSFNACWQQIPWSLLYSPNTSSGFHNMPSMFTYLFLHWCRDTIHGLRWVMCLSIRTSPGITLFSDRTCLHTSATPWVLVTPIQLYLEVFPCFQLNS